MIHPSASQSASLPSVTSLAGSLRSPGQAREARAVGGDAPREARFAGLLEQAATRADAGAAPAETTAIVEQSGKDLPPAAGSDLPVVPVQDDLPAVLASALPGDGPVPAIPARSVDGTAEPGRSTFAAAAAPANSAVGEQADGPAATTRADAEVSLIARQAGESMAGETGAATSPAGDLDLPTHSSPSEARATASAARTTAAGGFAPASSVAASGDAVILQPLAEASPAELRPTAAILRSKAAAASSAPPGDTSAQAPRAGPLPEDAEEAATPRLAARLLAHRLETAASSTSPPSEPAALRSDIFQPTPQSPIAAAPTAVGAAMQTSSPSLNLAGVIDQIVEARQAAGGGTISFSVAHGDFGPVGIRLEQAAGAGLAGFALLSADPGFAPAVQAALAERPQSERQPATHEPPHVRAEQQEARSDNADPHADARAQHSRHRADDQRAPHAALADVPAGPGSTGDDPADTEAAPLRRGARGLYA